MVSKNFASFPKLLKKHSPKYLFHLSPSNNNSYQTRNGQNLVIAEFKVSNNFLLNFFFSSALVEWNKLDSDIRNSPSYSTFKKNILMRLCSNENTTKRTNFSHPSPRWS